MTADSGTSASLPSSRRSFTDVAFEPEQRALEAAAALDRLGGLQPGDVTRPAGVILGRVSGRSMPGELTSSV